jgi:hypothetical protein
MAPRRISTRWLVSAQFTRQTSTSALSQRPSRMSVSVIRSERSTPSASWASTERSPLERSSEATKPALGLEGRAVERERPVVIGEAEVTPSDRTMRQHQASVVVPSSRWACSVFRRVSSAALEPSGSARARGAASSDRSRASSSSGGAGAGAKAWEARSAAGAAGAGRDGGWARARARAAAASSPRPQQRQRQRSAAAPAARSRPDRPHPPPRPGSGPPGSGHAGRGRARPRGAGDRRRPAASS